MDILKSSQLVIFSHSTIFIFLQKSCRFSLQTLTKFEAAKTGSGVGFLRLTAVWTSGTSRRSFPTAGQRERRPWVRSELEHGEFLGREQSSTPWPHFGLKYLIETSFR